MVCVSFSCSLGNIPAVSIHAEKGKSILDIAFENDIVIDHECGGVCACTTCRVDVISGMEHISAKGEDEREMLESDGYKEVNTRLACQAKIISDSGEIDLLIAR
ncbi:MAG: 2Fe-2S iron-sulfur cluster-binding protein [Ignavibacteriae bacterium]|nr:2Fe-2S iron-sulfur cluster-binding protein [Ignavibacteriota bacterium]